MNMHIYRIYIIMWLPTCTFTPIITGQKVARIAFGTSSATALTTVIRMGTTYRDKIIIGVSMQLLLHVCI